jgi:hypothetical protein
MMLPFRHYEERFRPDAPFRLRRTVQVGDKTYQAGEPVVGDLYEQIKSKIELWWNAQFIELDPDPPKPKKKKIKRTIPTPRPPLRPEPDPED